MHPSTRQPAQKGPDGCPLDLALQASELLLSTTQIPEDADQVPQQPQPEQDTFSPPLMHFPHCRLELVDFPHTSLTSGYGGKLEQIALPGPLVRTLLSRFESELASSQPQPHSSSPPPSPPTTRSATLRPSKRPTSNPARPRKVQIQRHFDDADDWVFSRCLLADFTGFREDEAEVLSAQGRLCCWGSVVLQPQRGLDGGHGEGEGEEGKWELGFVVHRVGVRHPETGWCECF